MKLTNRDIYLSRAPLQTLIGMKFPVASSFKLARMANRLNDALRDIETVRTGLVKKYGEPGEGGQTIVPEGSATYPRFLEEIDELMAMDVEVVIEKVKLPEEVDGKPLEVEPSLLMALEKFVE